MCVDCRLNHKKMTHCSWARSECLRNFFASSLLIACFLTEMGHQKYGGRPKVGAVAPNDWCKKVKADLQAHPYTTNGHKICPLCAGTGEVATSSRNRRVRKSKKRARTSSSSEDSAQSSSDSGESSLYSLHSQSRSANSEDEVDELVNDDADWEDVLDEEAAVHERNGVTNVEQTQDNGPGGNDGDVVASQPDYRDELQADPYPMDEFPLTQRTKEREPSVISISSSPEPLAPVSHSR